MCMQSNDFIASLVPLPTPPPRRWIDSFLQTDAAEDLKQCGTLAGVIKHLQLLKIAEESSNVPSPTPIQPPPPAAAAASSPPARTLRKRH